MILLIQPQKIPDPSLMLLLVEQDQMLTAAVPSLTLLQSIFRLMVVLVMALLGLFSTRLPLTVRILM